jgi:hypothetical protein
MPIVGTQAAAVGPKTDWGVRQAIHREDEWQIRGLLIESCREILKKFADGTKGATLGDVARALDLAQKLGRLSTGMPTETVVEEKKHDLNVLVAVDVALDKIFGREAKSVVTVEASEVRADE